MIIEAVQNEIVEEFSMLDGDLEMTLNYLIELGEKMPTMDDQLKTDSNIVKGCQSKVWMVADYENNKILFKADSNTAITKGLVSLLVRTYSGQSAEQILHSELFFPEKIGMQRFIGTQRSNGFASMMKQIKMYALAFSTQNSTI